mmetsp:Transcript_22949/g.40548  ORF Transcript_22949/g.40548 Transcript_22949/m.40548 type:complete len:231 (-) Transcript_22949:96-788(-)|eukprot:CAMPEP_0175055660 /NCGR_PEP_ID=MMETSP0052_2-20121109/10212_1 /TAXON_ID=51329 ORGANISM="Polytomella parva, Strain SAG 63-3" /NCGR_SAMPLE_ID=MMETSP0052_2 /ASSEMBLY_ACC=CAM_ASM_000194 /LENGTH=230 /DNA_ID=CAMNT_0016320547 /DNA_START=82 /DNA_END=774 /DNA_ORIENTATION=+
MGSSASRNKRPSKVEINDTDKAILSLKTQRQKLESQERLLQLRLDNYVTTAKQLIAESRKDRALLTLKKKKMTENQLLQLHGLIINVEQMLSDVESTKQSTKVFGVLKAGNDILKTLQAQVRLDDVQRLMDDTAETAAYQRELNALLSQQLGEEDVEGAEEELEMLEKILEDEEVLQMPNAPPVPQLNETNVKQISQKEILAKQVNKKSETVGDDEVSINGGTSVMLEAS